jgi:hypothetical protein
MARRYHKKHSSHKKKIPILATAGVLGTGIYVYEAYKVGGPSTLMHALTGMNPNGSFVLHDAMVTYTPAIIGVLGSAIASKTHINRYMSGIPMFKF